MTVFYLLQPFGCSRLALASPLFDMSQPSGFVLDLGSIQTAMKEVTPAIDSVLEDEAAMTARKQDVAAEVAVAVMAAEKEPEPESVPVPDIAPEAKTGEGLNTAVSETLVRLANAAKEDQLEAVLLPQKIKSLILFSLVKASLPP